MMSFLIILTMVKNGGGQGFGRYIIRKQAFLLLQELRRRISFWEVLGVSLFVIMFEVVSLLLTGYYDKSKVNRRGVLCVKDMLWLSSLSLK